MCLEFQCLIKKSVHCTMFYVNEIDFLQVPRILQGMYTMCFYGFSKERLNIKGNRNVNF